MAPGRGDRRLKFRLMLAAAGFLIAAIACGGRGHPPNVVIIGVDSLRPDHLGCYGYERNTSPNIDRLARDGALFENTLTQAPWTTASFGTILTSLYPTQHGAVDVSNHMRPSVPTLATLLKGRGYATGAVVNAPVLKPSYGLGRGFDYYNIVSDRIRAAEETTTEALRWIDANEDGPFLMFVHYFDVHTPYAPPPPYDSLFDPNYEGSFADSFDLDFVVPDGKGRVFKRLHELSSSDWNHVRSLYDGEIAVTDKAIGNLMAGLQDRGLRGRTLIVLVSDHGEEFAEHGGFEHGHSLFNELLRVPMIFCLPGTIPKGTRLPQQARLLDVTPTILDIAGIDIPAHLEGASLRPVILGAGGPRPSGRSLLPPDAAYSEGTIYGSQKRAITQGGWKLICDNVTEEMQLFNLVRDPAESRNLIDSEPGARASLEETLIRTILGISDSWYIEMAGGDEAHVFDLTLAPEKGPLITGSIHPYRFFDGAGHLVALDGLVTRQAHVLRIECPHLQAPITLAFKVGPDIMPLKLDLRIDGKPATDKVFLGQSLVHPETMPFTQIPRRAKGRSQGVPTQRPSPPYILVWHTENPYAGDTAFQLDDQTKKELRALGYVQ